MEKALGKEDASHRYSTVVEGTDGGERGWRTVKEMPAFCCKVAGDPYRLRREAEIGDERVIVRSYDLS